MDECTLKSISVIETEEAKSSQAEGELDGGRALSTGGSGP